MHILQKTFFKHVLRKKGKAELFFKIISVIGRNVWRVSCAPDHGWTELLKMQFLFIKDHVNDEVIRKHLKAYEELGIVFVRDGGDALGVSERARRLAPEYGIDYRTPVFAIHKNGHYGSIVGKGFDTMKEYHVLLKEAKNKGQILLKL